MSDLDVRIAKCLGWREDPALPGWQEKIGQNYYYHPVLPDWSRSLDLMWKLEEDLHRDECDWEWYIEELENVVGIPSRGRLVHATAEQKAKAWLKVKEHA